MAGVSFDVFRSAFVSVVNVFNSSVDDEATTTDGAGKEIQRVPYYGVACSIWRPAGSRASAPPWG